jgi:DNA-directed RNA polymerase specialized sigma24 family protein
VRIAATAELDRKHLERISAESLAELPSAPADVLHAWEEEQSRLERFEAAVHELLSPKERKLVKLRADGVPAADAERRLGLPAGTWRNLRKRLRRKLDNPTT